jgi:heme-degrading monooxygenase HmoA
MYARVITTQSQPVTIDEGLQIFLNSILPAARQQPGYKGAIWLVDRTAGKAISISLWETGADLRVGEASGYLQAQIAKALPLITAAPVIETYEVGIQEVQKGGAGGYARVLTGTNQLGKIDEGIQIVRDSILPVTRQQPGYKGYLSLTDRTTGKAISISFWETEVDLLASETSGYLQEQLGKVAHVLATQVVREVYEVAVQE